MSQAKKNKGFNADFDTFWKEILNDNTKNMTLNLNDTTRFFIINNMTRNIYEQFNLFFLYLLFTYQLIEIMTNMTLNFYVTNKFFQ